MYSTEVIIIGLIQKWIQYEPMVIITGIVWTLSLSRFWDVFLRT